jgi:hypothetical protein
MELRHFESSADGHWNNGAPDTTFAGEVMPNGVGVGFAKLQANGNAFAMSAKWRLLNQDEVIKSFEESVVNGDGLGCNFGSSVAKQRDAADVTISFVCCVNAR